jgi:hypothetical protein
VAFLLVPFLWPRKEKILAHKGRKQVSALAQKIKIKRKRTSRAPAQNNSQLIECKHIPARVM